MRNKQRIITLVAVLVFLLMTVGVTYAFFSYIRRGTTENTISSDSITFLYEEIDKQGNGISITEATPVDDATGKQGQAFNFRIISTTTNTISIPYEINVRKKDGSDNLDNIVKLYLTKVDDNNLEEETVLLNYSDLETVTKNNHQEKRLHIDKVPASRNGYSQKYRLRMWIDKNADFSTGDYNDKTFSVTVNVYSSGHVDTQEDIQSASNINVTSVSVNNTTLTASNNLYQTELEYGTPEAMVNVETENPYTNVVIEKTDSTYTNVIAANTGIQRLSVSKKVPLVTGDNYFRIRLTSEDGTATNELHLKIKVKGLVWEYTYNSSIADHKYTINIPVSGNYMLEVWGAQGGTAGSYRGGFGAYATGIVHLEKNQELFVVVGSKGDNCTTSGRRAIAGGFNGGGYAWSNENSTLRAAGGGGATHIATVNGELKNLVDYKDTFDINRSNEILIVASGGAGGYGYSSSWWTGNNGGGYTGGYSNNSSAPGTQTTGYAFGQGGGLDSSHIERGTGANQSGGGGGWYGGHAWWGEQGAGGGSSYIASPNLTDGKMFCYGCLESTSPLTYTVRTNGSSPERNTTNCPNGYSSNPISKCAKTEHGYAKITYLGN